MPVLQSYESLRALNEETLLSEMEKLEGLHGELRVMEYLLKRSTNLAIFTLPALLN